MTCDIESFFEPRTGTFSYVVSDPATGAAAVIDPVLGFVAASGHTDPKPVEAIADYVAAGNLHVEWILETHAHADHLSGAQLLKSRVGGRIAIGRGICEVQAHFGRVFNLQAPFAADGHQFDHLFDDGDSFAIGNVEGRVMHTPGHTNDSVTYVIANAAFVGDTLFMTDVGTARCDFPGGDAGLLYDSIQRLFSLPAGTDLYLCHDYPPAGRDPVCRTPLADQKRDNMHVGGGTSRDEFVDLRKSRDRTLAPPQLILPSIQVNIQAGHLPDADDNGIAYLRIPVDTL